MDFSQFIPHSSYEWVLFVLVVVLLITLLLYNKAILKCKDLISNYSTENRAFKKLLDDNCIDYYQLSQCFGDADNE